ncbi:hypothetical protein [Dolichospermum flos-aquae]|uniref:Uncharacterized protein n=1 Tax=Dolichospermum flos-aquae LEGE 04289 TaxID=1828708 RepID=A0ACC5Q0P6_DOLFA|nr:hypothetical protein [Dolichospermum flos-aquae]MBE9219162.1 hypothetical protein [Dolichospermum flos-aquae LEGE 04289]
MQFRQLKLLLITLGLIFPMVAQAGEMNLQVGKIKINRDYRGNTTVNTGEMQLDSEPDIYRSQRNYEPDIYRSRRNLDSAIRSRNINTLKRNCTESNNEVVSHQTIKTRGSNQQRTQTSTVSVSCN